MKMCNNVVAIAALTIAGVSAAPVALAQEMRMTTWSVMADSLEYRYGDENERLFSWGTSAWYGTDDLKAVWKSEGEYDLDASAFEKMENQLLLKTPVSDFFDLQGGLRFDTPDGENRNYAVLGVSGLAPQWIEVESNLFLSEKGDVSARFGAEYELLLTNYWILTPEVELDVAFSDVPELEIASGFTSVETGLRLSYDLIDRALSPYLGVSWESKLGDTADCFI